MVKPIQPEKALWGGKLTKFRNASFEFKHPRGTVVLTHPRGAGEAAWELLANLDGDEYSYKITVLPAGRTAKEHALELYQANHRPGMQDVHPYALMLPNLQGWRCVVAFIDPASAPLTLDTVFLETRTGRIFQLQYPAHPDLYGHGLVVFELLLRTLKIR